MNNASERRLISQRRPTPYRGNMEKNQTYTLLIIEDDAAVLSAMEKYLKFLGYDLIIARDGMEGIKKIRSGGYHLVITDVVMPYVNGSGIVSLLKRKINPQIPIIAITGFGKEAEAVVMEKEADLVLTKPVKMHDLKAQIERLLSEKESRP